MRAFLILVLALYAFPSNAQTLRFKDRIAGDSVRLDLVNYMHGPVFLRLTPRKPYAKRTRMPEELVIQALDSLSDVVAIAKDEIIAADSVDWSDYFTVFATLGDPYHSNHNDDHLYTLPFPKGKAYSIMQSWNGKFSHRSVKSKYAIDFDLAVGDTVCAARDGMVIHVEEHFNKSGGREFRDKANQIVVLHLDGTMAFYVHLKKDGVFVNPGQCIERGQRIGLSGNTGFSTRPHLHFVVREAPDKSVPIYFQGYEGKKLRKRRTYKNK